MKKTVCLLFFVLFFNTNIWGQKGTQRLGINTAYLIQNSPFKEISTLQLTQYWYAQQYDYWRVGDSGMGLAVGLSYDVMISKLVFFRFQTQIETTGWISWLLDLGFGIRMPVKKNQFFIIDVSVSTQQTGGKLSLVDTSLIAIPNHINAYIGLFGFKGRLAYEFNVTNNFFITPFISYAAYPWMVQNLKANIYINGIHTGILIDSLQIGFEFGSKF